MADAKDTREAERQRAKALARWEGEGGALGPSAKTEQALDEAELRILSRLGTAVLGEWNKIPSELRQAIVARASTLHAPTDSSWIKVEIVRLLQKHKDN